MDDKPIIKQLKVIGILQDSDSGQKRGCNVSFKMGEHATTDEEIIKSVSKFLEEQYKVAWKPMKGSGAANISHEDLVVIASSVKIVNAEIGRLGVDNASSASLLVPRVEGWFNPLSDDQPEMINDSHTPVRDPVSVAINNLRRLMRTYPGIIDLNFALGMLKSVSVNKGALTQYRSGKPLSGPRVTVELADGSEASGYVRAGEAVYDAHDRIVEENE